MSSVFVSTLIFAVVFSGSLLGISLGSRLPDHHLASESRDVVRLAMGLVSTMVALALGLLIGSAKSFYDTQNADTAQLAANAVLLDRLLAHYGPEANGARKALRTALVSFSNVELSQGADTRLAGPHARAEELLDAIQELHPSNDNQRSLQSQELGIAIAIGQTRWLIYEQRAIPVPLILLGVLVFWLVALFVSFGLFAQPNGTLISGLFIAALAVSMAIFLIIEMYHPYSGLIQVSDSPIRAAMAQLGR